MNPRTLIYILVALPLTMSAASAAQRLSKNQMDMITAGQSVIYPLVISRCADCTLSSSASTSVNGVTNTSASTSSPASSTGSSGNGGSTSGNSESQRSPSLLGSVTIPPAAAVTLQGASVITTTQP